MRVAVITVSDSVVAGKREDTSGAVVAGWVKAKKYELVSAVSCVDETVEIVQSLVLACDWQNADLVLTTGGTGLAPRDRTYEAMSVLLEKRLDGFGEAFRRLSWDEIGPPAVLSRAVAGVHRGRLLVALPGNPKAVALAAIPGYTVSSVRPATVSAGLAKMV